MIRGSPLTVTPNQTGVSFTGEYPVVELNPVMHNLGPLTKQVKLTNTGPTDMNIEWKMYNLGEGDLDADLFKLGITDPDPGTDDIVKLKWNPIAPREAENGPFTVSPKTACVKGRKTETFTVTFHSTETRVFNSVMVARPKLVERPEDEGKKKTMKVEDLPVYLDAHTVQPQLSLDKRTQIDGSHMIRFEKWALYDNKKSVKKIILKNRTLADLIFNVELDG
mmetsp:Transcript_27654/g.24320  ORF Transcript_27654/g.24320 Transcript_27654/m.24320 type:complete len:222 (+) Transcript_27654:241-906(+)